MDGNLSREYTKLEGKLGFYFGRILSRPLVPPDHVYFSLTNRCNLRCAMCEVSKSPSHIDAELPTAKVEGIILQIKNLGVKHLILSGGEPLLRDDLVELVEFSTSHNIEMVDIISNGTLLTDDNIQRLIKVRLNHITVSLDGLKGTNDQIRGVGSFEKAEKNIDKINYYKFKYNVSFPTVGINFTIMGKNVDDIVPMVDFARSKKCNIIVFQPVLFNNVKMHEKKRNPLWPSQAEILKLKDAVEKIIEIKKSVHDLYICTDTVILGSLANYFNGILPGASFRCYEGIKRIVVTCAGNLWSCAGEYGDLKHDDLEKIWFSQEATVIRGEVKKCRKHCLQDCIYFSTDILEETFTVLKKIGSANDAHARAMREKLLKNIESYTRACFQYKGRSEVA